MRSRGRKLEIKIFLIVTTLGGGGKSNHRVKDRAKGSNNVYYVTSGVSHAEA